MVPPVAALYHLKVGVGIPEVEVTLLTGTPGHWPTALLAVGFVGGVAILSEIDGLGVTVHPDDTIVAV